jgi:hypothetical protein
LLEAVTGLFARLPQHSRSVSSDRTNRLYQWLGERARFFRSDTSGRGTSRTVRTEVTVQREAVTVLVGEAAAGFDTCPFCGSKLAPAQAEQAKPRLRGG